MNEGESGGERMGNQRGWTRENGKATARVALQKKFTQKKTNAPLKPETVRLWGEGPPGLCTSAGERSKTLDARGVIDEVTPALVAARCAGFDRAAARASTLNQMSANSGT